MHTIAVASHSKDGARRLELSPCNTARSRRVVIVQLLAAAQLTESVRAGGLAKKTDLAEATGLP